MLRYVAMEAFKENFERELFAIESSINSSTIKDMESYTRLVNEVLEAKSKPKKEAKDYRRINRYDVLWANGEAKLVSSQNAENGGIKFYVHNGQVFDILKTFHEECGHGGLHKMEKAVQTQYANISRPIILMFLRHCETCHRKRAHPKKGVVVQPLLFKEVNARGQVDLIDYQSCKDGEFKFVLNYQDHLSKFVNLRPLKTKTAAEVAYHLIDIFCVFGAPSVLQSDNGKEFVNATINEMHLMWPSLKIVHGKPRHSQSQGSIERANRDVGDMIRAWMADNNSKKWHEGLRFVQFQKNNSYHEGIKQSPFEAMFGRKAALGLCSTLPVAVANAIQSEDDVHSALMMSPSSTSSHATDDVTPPTTSTDAALMLDDDSSSGTSDDKSNTMRRNLRSTMEKNRKRAISGLEKQAKRMKKASDANFKVLECGTTVTIPVPEVDRSKCNLRNIIGKATSHYSTKKSSQLIMQ